MRLVKPTILAALASSVMMFAANGHADPVKLTDAQMDGVTAGLVEIVPPGTDLITIATVNTVLAGNSNVDLPDAVLHTNAQGGDQFTGMGPWSAGNAKSGVVLHFGQ